MTPSRATAVAGFAAVIVGGVGCGGDAGGGRAQPSPTSATLAVAGLPSNASAGSPLPFTVSATIDGAVHTGFVGTVTFSSDDPQAVLPAETAFLPADRGVRSFSVTFKTAGNRRVVVSSPTAGIASGSLAIVPAEASLLLVTSGNHQSGFVGQRLVDPLTVVARDPFGNLAPGTSITFAPSAGASVENASVVAGPSGTASTAATLGPSVGTYTFDASAGSATASFTSEARVPRGSTLVPISAGGSGEAGTTLADSPLVVKALGPAGEPLAGVIVHWSASAGGGSVKPVSSTTGAGGEASAVATLGTRAGANVFQASALDLAGSPVSLAWTGTAGPTTQLLAASGDLQRWVHSVGSQLPDPLAVKAADRGGNGKAGVTVTFSGSVSPSSCTTGQDGTCAVSASVVPGMNAYTVSSGSLTPFTFQAFGLSQGLVYSDPGPAPIRLVRNPSSTPTLLVLDLVAGSALSGFSVGFDVVTAPEQVVLGGAPITPGDALGLGSGVPAVGAALPSTGPHAGMWLVGLSRKAPDGNATVTPGMTFMTVRVALRNYGIPGDVAHLGTVFDGAIAGTVVSAGLRNATGQDQVPLPVGFAVGRLEVR